MSGCKKKRVKQCQHFLSDDATAARPDDAVLFAGVSLVLGATCRLLFRGTRVPYTIVLLILGVALGSLEYGTKDGLGKLGAGIRIWANINPDLLLAAFLPALLFERAFSMEAHQIKKCMVQMLLLAGPGVLMSTFFLGTALKLTFPYGWNWEISLLLGGLLSATDPVAVVAHLKELGTSKKLNTIIEGESLMNDGVSVVVYQLFYGMVLGRSFNAGSIIVFLSEVSLGAVALGVVFGIISLLWLGFIFDDTILEMTLTLAVSYLAFYTAMVASVSRNSSQQIKRVLGSVLELCFTAQDALELSGILTVMTLGMEIVAYVANTLIFILSGVVIADGVLQDNVHFERNGTSWGFLLLLYVFVQMTRVVVVGVCYPLLRYFGYGLDFKEATVLIWSGLRGAVSLSLALSVNRASDTSQPLLKPEVGTMFVFFTGGIVFLTLILNGSTTQFLLHALGMDNLSATKLRMLNYTRHEMLNKALEAFGDLRDDEELGPADWVIVKKYITCFSNLENERVHPHADRHDQIHTMNLGDIRVRLLNGVQATYWVMLEEGRITQTTANILIRSVDEAMGLVSSRPLCDWNGLQSSVHFPSYSWLFSASSLPQRLITYFTVQRLESGCFICAAFLHAHRIARRQLHDFLGDNEIVRIVIDESSAMGEEARKFLEEVRCTFPQLLCVLKTRQVTYSLLTHMSEYVQNLRKTGLLEEKEMIHLDDVLQTDLKKLKRNPPLVKMPSVSDLLDTHPLVGVLPVIVRAPLLHNTKETVKQHGTTLYMEGSRATGVWIISTGLVKRLSSMYSLDPILSHGSTLGLYEVLTGKSYICDMISDSLVRCFFIEAEKMEQLRRSDPSVEALLWRESALVVAKLLIPRIFERITMHETRLLIAKGSTMNIYTEGEDIVLDRNQIGILLEGLLKAENQNNIISPGLLLPSNMDLELLGLPSSANRYQVQARARVIIFEAGRLLAEANLQRSSPLLSLTLQLPGTIIRDHSGLLSWPESSRGSTSLAATRNQQGELSAKALDLSMELATEEDAIVNIDSPSKPFLGNSPGAP